MIEFETNNYYNYLFHWRNDRSVVTSAPSLEGGGRWWW